MKDFENFVITNGTPNHDDLPCWHTTSSKVFVKILKSPTLTTAQCPIYESQKLYFFYGRPSYRLRLQEKEIKLLEYLPVCLAIYPSELEITAAAAFDTGAWDLILEHVKMEKDQKRDDFSLSDLNSVKCLIDFFFRDNYRYVRGDFIARKELDLFPEFHAGAYLRIISSDEEKLDNRARTIELQLTKSVDLKPKMVSLLILPDRFMSARPYDGYIRELFPQENTTIITYDPMDLTARDFYGHVNYVFLNYLKTKTK